ncbi:MAG TPA: hypothetical protein VJH21_00455 [Candidatus Paceibacterota bacterium]
MSSESKRQEVFWNRRRGWREIAEANFKRLVQEGRTVEAYCGLASALYSRRWPILFHGRLREAKKTARSARSFANKEQKELTANQLDVLSTILAAVPATDADRKLAERLARRGMKATGAVPHTRAFLRLTCAKIALAEGCWSDAVKLCGEVQELLPAVEESTKDKNHGQALHNKRQQVRVLKQLAVLLVKLGDYGVPMGWSYLEQAEKLARVVSKDQLKKIRWARRLL